MLPITVNWERSPSAPTPVFGYDTKQNYAPQPTDNVYDSGNFNTINPNVFMGKRANDGKLNFKQYGGKMFSQYSNYNWEQNINWAGKTGMSKSASYQGESVNFDQELNTRQLSAIVTQDLIPRVNKIMMEYPQDPTIASARSDTDIWNNINRYIYGKSGAESSPRGDWQADKNAIFPRVQRNESSIKTMENQHIDFQRQLNEAKAERDSIQEKLEGKAMLNHTHSGLGLPPITITTPPEPENPFGGLIPSLSLSTIAIGGLAAYLLLGKKK